MDKYTKFEKARLIGARALQISMGAPFKVKLNEKELEDIGYNPVEIAKMEFEQGVIPMEVKKMLPSEKQDAAPVKAFDQTKLE